MTTPSIEELISAYIDGELDSATSERVRNEIASSPGLQDLETGLRELSGQLRKLPAMKPGIDLSVSILEKLERKASPALVGSFGEPGSNSGRRRGRAWLKIGAALVTTAAALVLAVVLWNPDSLTGTWNVAASGAPAPSRESAVGREMGADVSESPAPSMVMKDSGESSGAAAPGSSFYKVDDSTREVAASEPVADDMLRASKQGPLSASVSGSDPTVASQRGAGNERHSQSAGEMKRLPEIESPEKLPADGILDKRDAAAKSAVPPPAAIPGNIEMGEDRQSLAGGQASSPAIRNIQSESVQEAGAGMEQKNAAGLALGAGESASRPGQGLDANKQVTQLPLEKPAAGGGGAGEALRMEIADAGRREVAGGSGFGIPGPVIATLDKAADVSPQAYSIQIPSPGNSWQRVAESISGKQDSSQLLPGNENVRDVFVFVGTIPEWDAMIGRIVSAEKGIAISLIDSASQVAQLPGLEEAFGEAIRADQKSGFGFRRQGDLAMELRQESKLEQGNEEFNLYYYGRIDVLEKAQAGGQDGGGGVGGAGQVERDRAGSRGLGMGGRSGGNAGAVIGSDAAGGAGSDDQNAGGGVAQAGQTGRDLDLGKSGGKGTEQLQRETFKENRPELQAGIIAETEVRRILVLSVAPKQAEVLPADQDK